MHDSNYILRQISLKFVPNYSVKHKLTLVQVMAWRHVIYWHMYASLSLDDLMHEALENMLPHKNIRADTPRLNDVHQHIFISLSLFQCIDWGMLESLLKQHQAFVSLTFRELSKIFSWNLCIAEIVVLMRISSWNFVRVPKAWLWAHVQSFSLKLSP